MKIRTLAFAPTTRALDARIGKGPQYLPDRLAPDGRRPSVTQHQGLQLAARGVRRKNPEGSEVLVNQRGHAVFLGGADEPPPGDRIRLPGGQPAAKRRQHAGGRRVPGAQAEEGADHGCGRVVSHRSRSSSRPWKEP